MTLGDIVKAYRKERGYSMDAFASMCGLSKGYISMLESNKSPKTGLPLSPSLDTFNRIASVLGITMDELFTMCDSDQPVSLDERIKQVATFDPLQEPQVLFALFGGTDNITPEMMEDVKNFARFVREQKVKSQDKGKDGLDR